GLQRDDFTVGHEAASALSRVSGSPSSALACQVSPRSALSQICPSARPAKRRPAAAKSAYGIAGRGLGRPPASACHSDPRPGQMTAWGAPPPCAANGPVLADPYPASGSSGSTVTAHV